MWPGKLQNALCARDSGGDASGFARLTVAFGANPCGKDYLACGDPAKRIDFDIAGTLYAVGTGAATSNVLGIRNRGRRSTSMRSCCMRWVISSDWVTCS